MTLLCLDDPVFVIDLSPAMMTACRAELERAGEGASESPEGGAVPEPPDVPLAAIALVLDWRADPLLLPIAPTRDTRMLDALARLIRIALLTEVPLARLATDHGDDELRRLYFARAFPRFVYEGFDPAAPVTGRLPEALRRAVGGRREG